ncbi:Phox homologous domain-containing protein [Coniella lustricola]|uniref:Endosomal/vacuolar adapter protein YPT35 n=1 Tax=Coniella lustricola TaxID=2025994 RepID=A0A2T2ZSG4_9PEZI|nr:Phox homologous domain-containing protein [Coniella lustricola]
MTPVTSPPYWAHNHSNSGRSHPFANHQNGNISAESLLPGAITLQDNEAEEDEENSHDSLHPGRNSDERRTSYGRDRNKACWAKSVEVTDYVTVNGSATNIGAFVVWNIRVQTLSGPYMNIRKRYSEFDDFRHQLIQTFPAFEAAVPVLPPKSVISKFRPRFLEKRRAGLQYFLNCILLNPEFSGSPVLKDFLFA